MSPITLRFATADDVGLLLQLIRELAAYERLGIEARNEWLPHGATGETLRHLAAQDAGAID